MSVEGPQSTDHRETHAASRLGFSSHIHRLGDLHTNPDAALPDPGVGFYGSGLGIIESYNQGVFMILQS